MQKDNLQVLYLANPESQKAFLAEYRERGFKGTLPEFLGEEISKGTLRHLNAETGANPHPFKAAGAPTAKFALLSAMALTAVTLFETLTHSDDKKAEPPTQAASTPATIKAVTKSPS